jgi:hypothetical protein
MRLNCFWLPSKCLLLFFRKNVAGAYVLSTHFGEQQINLLNPIIDCISSFITGRLTYARKGRFNLHLMNTEDQPFVHNGLRANIFSTPDAIPVCHIQNPRINNDFCVNNSREAFWVNESKYL